MHLTTEQATVIQKLLTNFQEFIRLYGDEESEELMRWLSSSLSIPNKTIRPVRFTVRFTNKLHANVVNEYFRSDKFVRVDKDSATVELVTMAKLDGVSESHIKNLFEAASIPGNDGLGDVDGAIMAIKPLVDAGATLISVTPDVLND